VVFVGVRCAKEELERRTRLRGDRDLDAVLAQHERVHAHGRYDLECDTTHASPLDCALSIKAFLALAPQPPRAFDELRARASAEGWTTGR
jgi:chloramphenicol 3-O phosphotransferase